MKPKNFKFKKNKNIQKISENDKSTMENDEDNSAVLKKINSSQFGTEFHSLKSFQNSLTEIQFLNKYFNCLKRGSPSDIKFIDRVIKNDPKLNIHDSKSDFTLGNIDYNGGLFPLYVACQSNNRKAIDLLIKSIIN